MAKRRRDGELWLRQAADDFRFARLAVEREFFAQACFVAQQVGEKAVKAVHYHLGARPVIGHSVQALLRRLNARAAVTAALVGVFFIMVILIAVLAIRYRRRNVREAALCRLRPNWRSLHQPTRFTDGVADKTVPASLAAELLWCIDQKVDADGAPQ